MKKSILILGLALVSTLIVPNAMAASSEVTWTDYEKYRDIHEGKEGRKHFRERTFKQFEEHFSKLASTLPENHTLKIDVTDVDLAGDTLAGGVNRMRIVKDIYSPKMTFSYQLADENGTVIKEEEVKLKDMNFMSNNSLKYRNESLGYEKHMLDKWFKKTFRELIIDTK
jgi:hypothetical protein